jgi:hypothetical protein
MDDEGDDEAMARCWPDVAKFEDKEMLLLDPGGTAGRILVMACWCTKPATDVAVNSDKQTTLKRYILVFVVDRCCCCWKVMLFSTEGHQMYEMRRMLERDENKL